MSQKAQEWLDAMLKERESKRTLYDALAKEYLPKNED